MPRNLKRALDRQKKKKTKVSSLRGVVAIHERWEEMIEDLVSSAHKRNLEHPESPVPQSMIIMVKKLQRFVAMYPMFIIEDAALISVICNLGLQTLESPLSENLNNILRPPYKNTVILLNTTPFIRDETTIDGDNVRKRQELWCIERDDKNNILYAYGMNRCQGPREDYRDWDVEMRQDVMEINLNSAGPLLKDNVQVIDVEQIENKDMPNPYNDPKSILKDIRLLMILGLLVALNSKQVVDSELVSTKDKLTWANTGVRKTKRSSYHKLTLSIKGLEYAQYLADKASGIKKTKSESRAHWRRGHFKLKRGKLYWWRAHLVGKKSKTVLAKDYIVTA